MSRSYSGNNRRGAIRIPQHAHPLVKRFAAELNEQQTTYAEVSERSGVGVDTLRFWMTRHNPRLDLFDAALNVVGLELTIREKRDGA
jgi:lambda repressor-like predicted transcriptional regulator